MCGVWDSHGKVLAPALAGIVECRREILGDLVLELGIITVEDEGGGDIGNVELEVGVHDAEAVLGDHKVGLGSINRPWRVG